LQTFHNASYQPPSLQVEMMPMPAFRPGTTNFQLLIAIAMVIAMTPFAYFVTRTVVKEKQSGWKVTFRAMGLKDSMFWLVKKRGGGRG
jgi:hypothetical protein